MTQVLMILAGGLACIGVAVGAYATGWLLAVLRRRRGRVIHVPRDQMVDAALANWARNTMVMVTTRTGYVWCTNLEELFEDERGSERTWSEPAAVVIGYGPRAYVEMEREHLNKGVVFGEDARDCHE